MKRFISLSLLSLTILTSFAEEANKTLPLKSITSIPADEETDEFANNFLLITPDDLPFWIQHSLNIRPMMWGQQHMVREALEQHPDIRISKNDMLGNVEFLIDSNSTLTTAKLLKGFRKKLLIFMPKTIQQEIFTEPKFKYQIKFKRATTSNINDTLLQSTVRAKLLQSLNCDKVLFSSNSIEIWSAKEIDSSKLEDEKNLQQLNKPLYGGGIESTNQLEVPKAKNVWEGWHAD